MSDHLSSLTLNAIVDGELLETELTMVTEHLHVCAVCTSRALEQSLLKTSISKAAKRYAPEKEIQARMASLLSSQRSPNETTGVRTSHPSKWRMQGWGWAMAAAMAVLASGVSIFEFNADHLQTAEVERNALVTEISDQHVATLAANAPPQVLSSDRHTVKPWFQGKIPFSFNLPEVLPSDVRLEGGNLTYLLGRPVAQLLYSVGKHHVSVFVEDKAVGIQIPPSMTGHAGFHLLTFRSNELNVAAISDVAPSRLAELMDLIKIAQLN